MANVNPKTPNTNKNTATPNKVLPSKSAGTAQGGSVQGPHPHPGGASPGGPGTTVVYTISAGDVGTQTLQIGGRVYFLLDALGRTLTQSDVGSKIHEEYTSLGWLLSIEGG